MENQITINTRGKKIFLETRFFINNEFVSGKGNQTIPIIDPSTEEIICEISEATEQDVDLAVQCALKAFPEWERFAIDKKARLFFRLADKLEENIEEFSIIESLNNGKPFNDAREDMKEVIRVIRYYGGWSDKLTGSTYANDGSMTIQSRKVPYGVVGLISPWNYPLLMAAWKLFPAIAAGNCAVLKCSEITPLTMLKFCHYFVEVGFPKGVVNVVPGHGHIAGERLIRHMDVSKISFTGSTAVGRKILKASSETNLKKVHLELGGKSPLVVFADANLDEAVKWAIDAAFRNSSQNCCAGSRLFVQDSIYDAFLKMLVSETKKIIVGSYKEDDNFIGPLVNKIQFDRVMNYIKIGTEQEKLNLCTGGKRLFDKGYFVEPTIYSNVPDSSKLAREEIFGPVLSVMTPFKTIHEALNRANSTEYGLGAGVFTSNMDTAEHFVRNIISGTVWVNVYNPTNYNIPFGGFKQSGFGRDNAYEGISEFTTTKAVYYMHDLDKFIKF